MEREQAVRLTQNLLRKMVERDGSDLFITAGFPPAIKVDGTIHKATDTPLNADQAAMMVRAIMNDKQIKEFDATRNAISLLHRRASGVSASAPSSSRAWRAPYFARSQQRFRHSRISNCRRYSK